jgi:PAS domain S-box-containing protein
MPLTSAELDAHRAAVEEASVDAVLAIDERGIIESFDPAAQRLFGYPAHEVVGKNVNMLMPSPYREEHDGYIQRYLRTGEKRIIGIGREVVGLRRDGSTFPMHLSVAEVRSGGRRLFAGIARDLTELQRVDRARGELLERLERTNAELERFTYTVSHDLKSPLITIRGFLGLLQQDVSAGDVERALNDVARISNAVDTMQSLLEDLLELSRIGRVANPSADVALGEVAAEAVEMLSGPIAEAGASVSIDSDLPVVFGDRTRLREVFQNLVENAIKFGAEGSPEVAIGVRHDGDDPVCFVRDNGIGIEERHQSRIFGLFEKLERKAEGTGIGLALVKRIVEIHGGRIWVESDGLGSGSCFCFTLQAQPATKETTR